MVKVVMEVVQEPAARFRVAVQAQSIRRAEALVRSRFPRSDARLLLPIDPEGFFVDDPAATPGVAQA